MAVKLLVDLVEIYQIIVVLVEMSILICYLFAGTGKPDTCRYPLGVGKVSYPRVRSRVGKDWQHGYARARVNALPALTRLTVIHNLIRFEWLYNKGQFIFTSTMDV
jgi:hypothetical protein